jgi:hypothetical protein
MNKIKRFSSYSESFDYYLAKIGFEFYVKNKAIVKVRGYKMPTVVRWIYELLGDSLTWEDVDKQNERS